MKKDNNGFYVCPKCHKVLTEKGVGLKITEYAWHDILLGDTKLSFETNQIDEIGGDFFCNNCGEEFSTTKEELFKALQHNKKQIK